MTSTRPSTQLCAALTGATGFVGRHVLPLVLAAGHTVRILVRDSQRLGQNDPRITPVRGDLFDNQALIELVQDVDAVIHLVGIIVERPGRGQTFARIHVEGAQRLLAAAQSAGVQRWVHMSALGARPNAVSTYHQTKWTAEEAVRTSGIPYTIFRPSLIHGPDGEFIRMVRNFWRRRFPPFVPYFGGGWWGQKGAGKIQPVWVEDVARCFTAALTLPITVNETYPLGGPDEFTWPGLYETIRKHLPQARHKKILAIPAWYAKQIAGLPGVPFNWDQVVMSQEDSTCVIAKAREHFACKFAAFEPTFAQYAATIGPST